ncbi:hypothetical protein BJV78DRAFT_1219398 [Lactifluus subvellereus]|nr:hypothetical protein BJV78DRAFT_1219398 [Lactifluus subvellereus]
MWRLRYYGCVLRCTQFRPYWGTGPGAVDVLLAKRQLHALHHRVCYFSPSSSSAPCMLYCKALKTSSSQLFPGSVPHY